MLDSLDTLIAFVLIFLVVSMLITIVVQIISSLANLRGHNLACGVAETFETIEPALAAQAKGLADHLLKDSMISDLQVANRVRVASAVRPDELFDLLHRIATGKKAADPAVKNNVVTLLRSLGLNPAALAAGAVLVDPAARARAEQTAAQVAGNLLGPLTQAVGAIPAGPLKTAAENAIAAEAQQAAALAQSAVSLIIDTANGTQAMIHKAYQKFEHWFETGQERAQQWFAIHMKYLTGFFAVLFALWLQLDAIEIFKLVSSNKAVRDNLVAQAGAIEAQATRLLADGNGTLNAALAAWKETAAPKLQAAVKVQEAVKGLEAKPTDSRGSLRQRVAEALGQEAAKDDLLKAFDAKVDETAKADLARGASDYKSVKTALDKTGFDLYPPGGWRWIDKEKKKHWWNHLGGMLFSAGLLSLGAPFWFNLLKSMMNLRSTVAKNIQDEKEKKPGDGGAGSAPVTVLG